MSYFIILNICVILFRYLATGCSFRSLYFEYLIGRQTVADIVKDTCKAIWDGLCLEYMKQPTIEDWKKISDKFQVRANFPHCVGAVDGKHIRVVKPSHTGSNFFNYKKYFSIVLMAVADSDYCFTCINVGAFGKESDSNVFKATVLGQKIYSGNIDLPEPKPLENNSEATPYVFVADEAFALCANLLRPYPNKDLTFEKKIFNYRLSRARRFVECSFGILANKWRIFHRPLDVNPEFADSIIKSCCVLHNFVRKRDGYEYQDTLSCTLESVPSQGTKANQRGLQVRNTFTTYFCSSHGSVPWQNNCI